MEIGVHELSARLARAEPTILLDVREPWEVARASLREGETLTIPLGEIASRHRELPTDGQAAIVVVCHHGVRSLHAARYLTAIYPGIEIVSLRGGLDAWSLEIDPAVPRY